MVSATLVAQAVTVSRAGDAVTVRAPGFTFIKGEPLARLRDGRSVRVELEFAVLPKPGASGVTRNKQTFVLSYDLWEERFAVSLVGPPSRSTAYLTSSAAEAWCIDQVTMSVAAMGALGRDQPFWLRLEYTVLDNSRTSGQDDSGFTLRGMIDALSGRRRIDEPRQRLEAGPFRLPN